MLKKRSRVLLSISIALSVWYLINVLLFFTLSFLYHLPEVIKKVICIIFYPATLDEAFFVAMFFIQIAFAVFSVVGAIIMNELSGKLRMVYCLIITIPSIFSMVGVFVFIGSKNTFLSVLGVISVVLPYLTVLCWLVFCCCVLHKGRKQKQLTAE